LDFCTQLTVIERDAGRLSEAHCYSLPSEAQWELACRAGTTTFTEFGDEIKSQQANFDGRFPLNSPEEGPVLARPALVGAYSPNQWEIYDMHGNVEEWCRNSLDAVCPPMAKNESSGVAVTRRAEVFASRRFARRVLHPAVQTPWVFASS
jgi:formylglycine-generating enzyme required for sulfatase activity